MGLPEILNKLGKFQEQVTLAANRAAVDGMAQVLRDSTPPVVTGQLRDSGHVRVDRYRNSANIEYTAPYARRIHQQKYLRQLNANQLKRFRKTGKRSKKGGKLIVATMAEAGKGRGRGWLLKAVLKYKPVALQDQRTRIRRYLGF